MIDYSKLSDFEINKLVARALDEIKPSDKITAIDCYLSKQDSDCVKWYKHEYFYTADFDLFNPCNNPSDAWHIITGSQISIIPPVSNGTNGWKAERFFNENCGRVIDCIDKKPLRAAMIVYLMMQEDK